MKKLDSVLHESQRINAIMTATIIRKAKVSCRLSDGTSMPKGTWVMSSINAAHHSEIKYENPMKFDGFRFSRMREQPGNEVKYQAVSTTDSFAFGTAPHTCPGPINQLKVLLAYIICNNEF
ncbi:hypothetical protein PILCRDRAFT_401541 [Piloderma croceum F 1598]|uniref:Cytochrome P450 n=1 Tax=Piloderma croceum (strain F 1598) TaxID=765440 RepID=A0A0C3G0J2_PILCF|nr:hypothetical protein PILCRDRAFT_401541 [Piloderma croceum F 1598]